MFFKNLCVYHLSELPADLATDTCPGRLHERLSLFEFQPVGRLESTTRGWVPPAPHSSGLVHSVSDRYMVCLQEQAKILPASVVREARDERVAEREESEHRRLGRREKARIWDEVLMDLLPRAFSRTRRTYAYLDLLNRRLVVDTGTWKRAEEVSEFLRAGFGSLPILPLQTDLNPQTTMTQWLSRGEWPPGVEPGEKVVLEEPSSDGGQARVTKQRVDSDDVLAHIKAGKRVRQLALTWDGRISCVLDADLSVKQIKFHDVVLDRQSEPESAAEAFDADLALMGLEVQRFLAEVGSWFRDDDLGI